MMVIVQNEYNINLSCVKLMTTKHKMTYLNSDAGVAYRPHIILNMIGLKNRAKELKKKYKRKCKDRDEFVIYGRLIARTIIHELIHIAFWMKGLEKSEGFIQSETKKTMKVVLKKYESLRFPYDRL